MKTSEIKESLHYYTYIEHSKSMKYAADENLKLFDLIKESLPTNENRIKGLGLYRSTLLLYAISVELILKARGLYFEIENIKNGEINSIGDFLNKWKSRGNGHELNKLIKFYNIELNNKEQEIIDNLQPYTIWDGRFPFPKDESQVIQLETGKLNHGFLKLDYNKELERFIERQEIKMI